MTGAYVAIGVETGLAVAVGVTTEGAAFCVHPAVTTNATASTRLIIRIETFITSSIRGM